MAKEDDLMKLKETDIIPDLSRRYGELDEDQKKARKAREAAKAAANYVEDPELENIMKRFKGVTKDSEILKSNDTKKLIDETMLKLDKGFLLVEGYQKNSPEVVEKTSFKSYTDKYKRLKSKVDTIGVVTGRDLVKEYEVVLKESETFTNSITVKEEALAERITKRI